MNRYYKALLFVAALLTTAHCDIAAAIPQGYYDNLSGLKGAELKQAVHNIIKNPATPGYGVGENKTWWSFYVTDQLPDGTYRNRYSSLKFPVGDRGTRPQKDDVGTKNKNGNYVEMNIEHSFPSSWWGGGKTSIYNDLFNLYPSDNSTNSAKSNYVMDQVNNPTSDDGYTKLGAGANAGETAWEPVDEYKGDFSRGYMYMITCWQDQTWTSRSTIFLDNNTYPTLKTWAANLYSQWCRKDRVSQVEIDRNNAVYSIQGNRNPYIDFPNLFEYLWGDSTNYAFDPTKTVIADGNYNPGTGGGGGGDDDDFDPKDPSNFNRLPALATFDFKANEYNMNEDVAIAPEGKTSVWRRDTKYGWVANAYIDNTRHTTDATLISPDIDLSDVDVAFARFSHAVNFHTSPKEVLTVYVIDDADYFNPINEAVDWPAGNSWSFLTVTPVDLSEYCGRRIRLGFRYTSNPDACAAWEISNLEVRGTATSGIDDITVDNDAFDPSMSAEYYTIDGRRVDPSASGLIIVRQGNRAYKLVR